MEASGFDAAIYKDAGVDAVMMRSAASVGRSVGCLAVVDLVTLAVEIRPTDRFKKDALVLERSTRLIRGSWS